mgnify:CR=1 FL=1
MKKIGLNFDKKAIVVDSAMRTNIEGIFAAGDVTTFDGKVKLIATGFGEAATAIASAKVYLDPAALGGFKVRLVDVRPDILHQAENIIVSDMEKGLARGKINGADAKRIKANIEYTVDLPAVAGSADVIIEAVPENGYPRGNLEMFDTTIGWRFVNEKLKKMYGTDSMPETAENVAKQFHISREAQDAFAFTSQMRAKAAMEANRFQDEIVPVVYTDQKGESVSVIRDEHPRPDTTPEKLARLKPLFVGGQIAGLIEDCPSVAQLLEEMVKEARAVLTRSMARL